MSGKWRWKPDRTFADIRVELQTLCDEIGARSGLRLEVEFEGARDAFGTPADDPIVQAVLEAGEQVSGEPPDLVGRPVVGDANLYVNEGGVTSIYYGPAAYGTAHSDDERVRIEMIAHFARVYAVTAMRYCGIAP